METENPAFGIIQWKIQYLESSFQLVHKDEANGFYMYDLCSKWGNEMLFQFKVTFWALLQPCLPCTASSRNCPMASRSSVIHLPPFLPQFSSACHCTKSQGGTTSAPQLMAITDLTLISRADAHFFHWRLGACKYL